MIDRFEGRYSFLSNFYDAPLTYEGITYRNSEAAYQSAKTDDMKRRKGFSDLSAGKAKELGRQLPLRKGWEDIKFAVMQDVVHEKFKQNASLALLLTETCSEELVEGNYWHDNTFGDCKCPKCQGIVGVNALGKILMAERRYWQETLGWPRKMGGIYDDKETGRLLQ